MIIKSFKIKDFYDDKTTVIVDVPVLSRYRDMKIFHDGIYAFFEVPELSIAGNKTERYTYELIGVNKPIPEGAEFICILDVVIELPLKEKQTIPDQAIQVIPIYKI